MQISWRKAMLGGLAATLAMTAVGVWAAPMMGMPAMNPAAMLATKMSNSMVMGWADGAPCAPQLIGTASISSRTE